MSEVKDYCFCSNWDGDGEIYNRDGEVVWRFRTTGLKRRPAEPGLFRSPVFAVSNAGGQELLTISRERMLPLARFRMVENGLPVCTIRSGAYCSPNMRSNSIMDRDGTFICRCSPFSSKACPKPVRKFWCVFGAADNGMCGSALVSTVCP